MRKNTDLLAVLSSIAEALVLSDADNVQALSGIHSDFQSLNEKAEELSLPVISKIAEAAAEFIEKIVLDEIDNADDAMEILAKAITCLQGLAEGQSLDALELPSQLGLEQSGLEATGVSLTPEKDSSIKKETEKEPVSKDADEISFSDYMAAIAADPELVADFIAESHEHMDSCNGHLLAIESDPGDFDALNAVFRAFHTIKGVASFLNLSHVRQLAHQAENLLDKARSGDIVLRGFAMDAIFDSLDTMKQMIEDLSNTFKSGTPVNSVGDYSDLLNRLSLVTADAEAPAVEKARQEAQQEDFNTFSLPVEMVMGELPQLIEELGEHLDIADNNLLTIEKDSSDLAALNSLFRCFHTIKGSSGFLGLKTMENIAHHTESLLDNARNGKVLLEGAASDLIFEAVDAFKHCSQELKETLNSGKKTIELTEYSELCKKLEQAASGKAQPPVERLNTKDLKKQLQGAIAQEAPSAPRGGKIELKDTVKVDSDRLDKLLDAIGELVIAETMVSQDPELRVAASPQVIQNITLLDKITRELQAMSTSLRMVPIQPTFQKMARLIRDLSKKVNKDIEFIMNGGETELDKTVIDRIGDPLVHMVRNAVDHGIEHDADARVSTGKPRKARVTLRAFHKGGNIYIEIEDDGRGLNREAILKKAIERGIVKPEETLADKDIYALIFAAGFSTAEKITEVSGRGVGMDVVKRNIEELRGQIEIQSTLGRGSIFTIRLPLTLAIIDGMVVRVNDERYIIPTLSIIMSVNVSKDEINKVQGRGEMLSLQGDLIPVFRLDHIFDIESENNASSDYLIVVVESEGMKTGIVVEELLGQQQIVIKNLGDFLKGSPGLAGGAIMPDGTVGLILDVFGLVKLANST